MTSSRPRGAHWPVMSVSIWISASFLRLASHNSQCPLVSCICFLQLLRSIPVCLLKQSLFSDLKDGDGYRSDHSVMMGHLSSSIFTLLNVFQNFCHSEQHRHAHSPSCWPDSWQTSESRSGGVLFKGGQTGCLLPEVNTFHLGSCNEMTCSCGTQREQTWRSICSSDPWDVAHICCPKASEVLLFISDLTLNFRHIMWSSSKTFFDAEKKKREHKWIP